MSLAQLDSQIEDLRSKAAGIQKRGTNVRDSLTKDRTLSDIGKREKLDKEREHFKTQLSDLRAQERDLIKTKRESLERQLFGLSTTARTDPHQVIAYRDAQERAAKLSDSTEAAALLASAARSDDRTLAAAIVARALTQIEPSGLMGSNGWRAIVNDYAAQHPADGDTLNDLINLDKRQAVAGALFAYMPPF